METSSGRDGRGGDGIGSEAEANRPKEPRGSGGSRRFQKGRLQQATKGPEEMGQMGNGQRGFSGPAGPWSGQRWFGCGFGGIGIELYEHLQAVPTALGDTVRQIIELTKCMAVASVGSDLLPLPLPYVPEEGEDTTQLRTRPHCAWMWLIVVTLNAGFLSGGSVLANVARLTAATTMGQQRALDELHSQVAYFLDLEDGIVKEMDWKKFFAARSISYTGEVMASPRTLTWRQMAPGLPPAEFCGRIDALELAEGAVRDMLLNPGEQIIPAEECPRIPPPGRVHFHADEVADMGRQLLERGLLEIVEPEEILVSNGTKILNGSFGVGKGSFIEGTATETEGNEILRWILSLTTSNAIFIPFDGDIAGLPSTGQWRQLVLEADEILRWSYEDLRGCFYLFRFPLGWSRLFALNLKFSRQELWPRRTIEASRWKWRVVLSYRANGDHMEIAVGEECSLSGRSLIGLSSRIKCVGQRPELQLAVTESLTQDKLLGFGVVGNTCVCLCPH